jgi:hypothetical protein
MTLRHLRGPHVVVEDPIDRIEIVLRHIYIYYGRVVAATDCTRIEKSGCTTQHAYTPSHAHST